MTRSRPRPKTYSIQVDNLGRLILRANTLVQLIVRPQAANTIEIRAED